MFFFEIFVGSTESAATLRDAKQASLQGRQEVYRSLQMLLCLTEQVQSPAWFTANRPLMIIHTIDYR